MGNTKVLLIGDSKWTDGISSILRSKNANVPLEIINDKKAANQRLEHNSYDVLILQERFARNDTLHLASLAYAMTRPCIVVTSNFISCLVYKFWLHFSIFTHYYKLTRKLITFICDTKDLSRLVEEKASNYRCLFDEVTKEIEKNTRFE